MNTRCPGEDHNTKLTLTVRSYDIGGIGMTRGVLKREKRIERRHRTQSFEVTQVFLEQINIIIKFLAQA